MDHGTDASPHRAQHFHRGSNRTWGRKRLTLDLSVQRLAQGLQRFRGTVVFRVALVLDQQLLQCQPRRFLDLREGQTCFLQGAAMLKALRNPR